jgi:hypothetical protein
MHIDKNIMKGIWFDITFWLNPKSYLNLIKFTKNNNNIFHGFHLVLKGFKSDWNLSSQWLHL